MLAVISKAVTPSRRAQRQIPRAAAQAGSSVSRQGIGRPGRTGATAPPGAFSGCLALPCALYSCDLRLLAALPDIHANRSEADTPAIRGRPSNIRLRASQAAVLSRPHRSASRSKTARDSSRGAIAIDSDNLEPRSGAPQVHRHRIGAGLCRVGGASDSCRQVFCCAGRRR